MGDKLEYVDGFGWELETDLNTSKLTLPCYFDKKNRIFYTKKEILEKKFVIDKEFFCIFNIKK